ncbi:hypothetical protein PM082_018202 [Marasmius tenuissimus]|nr:hypothetical protein PM082_018202 [Marasmius tenuissimus]
MTVLGYYHSHSEVLGPEQKQNDGDPIVSPKIFLPAVTSISDSMKESKTVLKVSHTALRDRQLETIVN